MINYDRTPYRATGRHGSRVQAANHRRRTEWQRAKNQARSSVSYAAWLARHRDVFPGWMLDPDPGRSGALAKYDIDGKPISMAEGMWLTDNITKRRIGLDQVGDFEVSTVHMPEDQRYYGEGPPLIFETMVFHRGEPVRKWLTSTKELAQQQHEWVCHAMAQESRGLCPHSGETFRDCKMTDLCDCYDYPEHEHHRQGS